jgi:hypothetical protein|tara:strand:+ start:17 stop:157 length:141 start_codon:yes stop_codon:yes gene_type:complete
MVDIIYEIDGEKQMIVMLEPEQANAILAEGAFGVTADNLIEVVTHD